MMKRVIVAANAAFIVFVIVAGSWVYIGQERSIGNLRRANDSLLAQSQKETRQAQAANTELNGKIATALPRVQLIYDVSEIGLAANQGKDTTQLMFAWFGKVTSLNDPNLNRLVETIGKDPQSRAATDEYIKYLAGSVLDTLR